MPALPDSNPTAPAVGALANKRTPSTPSHWEWRKIRRRPQGQQDRAPQGRRWYRLPKWDRRKPLTITVKWRGGAEAWIEVTGRGSMGRFTGCTALADVVAEIMRLDEHEPGRGASAGR